MISLFISGKLFCIPFRVCMRRVQRAEKAMHARLCSCSCNAAIILFIHVYNAMLNRHQMLDRHQLGKFDIIVCSHHRRVIITEHAMQKGFARLYILDTLSKAFMCGCWALGGKWTQFRFIAPPLPPQVPPDMTEMRRCTVRALGCAI